MSNASEIISLKNISRHYSGSQKVVALEDVTLSLKKGAFAALVGSSGSGKTTLLNIASGLDRPTSGEVMIHSINTSKLSQSQLCEFRSKNVGFIFQAFNLLPALTVIENIEFTSIFRGDDPQSARKKAIESLNHVGLPDKENFFPHQLSGGQQQRIAVARAIASQPQIIFADEPTANLDSKTALQLIDLFQKMNEELGITFLFSTHDHTLIQSVKNVFNMKDGKIL